ncbi:MAG TPA: hypothetical protein PLE55_02445, partial [Clostridiales bacterium]|nr:hypothetical protein [Clostridiales bacterium]
MEKEQILTAIQQSGIVAVVRAENPDSALRIAEGEAPMGDWELWFDKIGIGMDGAVGKFGEFVAVIGRFISDVRAAFEEGGWSEIGQVILEKLKTEVWPLAEAEMKTWPGKFWAWLTDPTDGALAQSTVNMNKMTLSIEAWSRDPGTEAAFEEIGGRIAALLIDAAKAVLSSDGTGESVIMAFLTAVWNGTKAFPDMMRNIAASIMTGFVDEIVESVTGKGLGDDVKS